MTLRELQEALEEEVLTRQSLSRELEAIRTANQNFARSESGRPGPSLPSAARLAWAREGSRSSALRSQLREAEARNRDLEAHVRQLQEQMELLQARGDAAVTGVPSPRATDLPSHMAPRPWLWANARWWGQAPCTAATCCSLPGSLSLTYRRRVPCSCSPLLWLLPPPWAALGWWPTPNISPRSGATQEPPSPPEP